MVFTQISTAGRKRGREEVTTTSSLFFNNYLISYKTNRKLEALRVTAIYCDP